MLLYSTPNNSINKNKSTDSDITNCISAVNTVVSLPYKENNTNQNKKYNTWKQKNDEHTKNVALGGVIIPNIKMEKNRRLMLVEPDSLENFLNDDDGENNYNKLNVIINYKDLLNFICLSRKCRNCNKLINCYSFNQTLCGLASTIYFQCSNCNHCCYIKPKQVKINKKYQY